MAPYPEDGVQRALGHMEHPTMLPRAVPAPSLAAAGLLLFPPTETSLLPLLTLQALLMSQ